ncbi:MAG: hypothetical protein ACRDKT_07630 [Actinomycetota bacterium]
MRLWRHDDEDGLFLEEVVPGTPIAPPLFLEFRCPGCDEFHSVSCDCGADHDDTFLCGCVPPQCPTCDYQLRNEDAVALDTDAIQPEPSYR